MADLTSIAVTIAATQSLSTVANLGRCGHFTLGGLSCSGQHCHRHPFHAHGGILEEEGGCPHTTSS
jgi:hypothetical protein